MKKLLLSALILSASFITVNAQVGHLDSTFGTNGLVRTDFGIGSPASRGRKVMLGPDGTFYIFFINGNFGYVARHMANGSLDLTYGERGYSVPIPINGWVDAQAVIQTDGKIIVGSYANDSNGNPNFLLLRLTTSGLLDNSFSEDGKQTNDSIYSQITALTLQTDGKIVAGGVRWLARYHSDGSLDTSFSGDGKVYDIGRSTPITSIAIQTDGKILIAFGGYVSRYLPNGILDNGFGWAGTVSFTGWTPYAWMRSIVLQNDSKIVVGGGGLTASGHEDFIIGRLNSNGSFDTSFSGDGVQITNFGGSSFGEAVTLQDDGKILMTGRFFVPGIPGADVPIARYNNDGSLDDSFSGDGKLISSVQQRDHAVSIDVQSDSKIILTGLAGNDIQSYYFVERFLQNGDPDSALDSDGILLGFKSQGAITYFNASIVQPDGKIIAAGHTSSPPNNQDIVIARYNSSGSLDSSFSEDGKQNLHFQTGAANIYAIGLQADGKIVVGGSVFNGNNLDFALARFNGNGTVDSSFALNGIALTGFYTNDDNVNSLAIQPDGKIVVAGYSIAAGIWNFALARYNPDGSLDFTFSSDGQLIVELGSSRNLARHVLIQADGKILAVGTYNINSNADVALVRLNPDGSFDLSFNNDGVLITDIGQGEGDRASAAALQNDGKIVVVGNISTRTNIYDFLIARYNVDGSFDSSFSNDGKLVFNLGSNLEAAHAIAIQQDGKILIGGSFQGPSTIDFGLVRLNNNGTSDSSFSNDGISTPGFDYGSDEIQSLSIFEDRVYAVGFTDYDNIKGAVAAFLLSEPATDPLVVNIPDTFALPNGVEINTVYKGYEPASKLTLIAETSGGTAPYTYKWSNGATTASIKVGPSSTKTYSVTVTDANGTTATASIMIKVVDVRCGFKLEKVLVCHKENSHRSATLCISADAVASHLRHGDNLGSCRQSDESDFLTISAHPNPSRHSFEISIKSNETVAAELFVWNILGKVIERKTVYTNSTVRIGAWYRPGIYLAEVKYKNKRAKTKLIKLPH